MVLKIYGITSPIGHLLKFHIFLATAFVHFPSMRNSLQPSMAMTKRKYDINDWSGRKRIVRIFVSGGGHKRKSIRLTDIYWLFFKGISEQTLSHSLVTRTTNKKPKVSQIKTINEISDQRHNSNEWSLGIWTDQTNRSPVILFGYLLILVFGGFFGVVASNKCWSYKFTHYNY